MKNPTLREKHRKQIFVAQTKKNKADKNPSEMVKSKNI